VISDLKKELSNKVDGITKIKDDEKSKTKSGTSVKHLSQSEMKHKE